MINLGRTREMGLDPRQEKLFADLKLVGEVPAYFFRDACRMMAQPEGLTCSAHLVGHLLREIEGALLDFFSATIGMPRPVDPERTDGRRIKIERIAKALRLDPAFEKTWKEFALHRAAHRAELFNVRAIDNQVFVVWDDFQIILAKLLAAFRTTYSQWLVKLEGLASEKKPTKKHLQELAKLCPNNPVALRLFFGGCGPEWLPLLAEKGYFANPPVPIQHDTRIDFPPWPQAALLNRLADSAPREVVSIIETLRPTQHPRLAAELVLALCKIGRQLEHPSAKLLAQLNHWAASPYLVFSRLPERLTDLMSQWVALRKIKFAVDLAATLFEIEPARVAREGLWFRRPTARIGHGEYQRQLTRLATQLRSVAPRDLIHLLIDLALQAVGHDVTMERSHLWLPAIESDDDPLDDLRRVVITVLRSQCEAILTERLLTPDDVLKQLPVDHHPVFLRLELHLLKTFPNRQRLRISERLLDRKLFEGTVRYEYDLLLREGFTHLPQGEKDKILSWIRTGPNALDTDQARVAKRENRELTDDEINRWQDVWRLEKLELLVGNLPGDFEEFRLKLVKQLGDPGPLSPRRRVAMGYGPLRPLTIDEFRTLGFDELTANLITFEPTSDPAAQSPEGLGQQLSYAVAENPSRFATHAGKFMDDRLDPTYVRAFVVGFREALQKKNAFDWEPILRLATWVLSRPEEAKPIAEDRRARAWGRDPDWSWTRAEIARLLREGLSDPALMSMDPHQPVWEMLLQLTAAPDPLAQASSAGDGEQYYADLSIDTISGIATHAIIDYALRQKALLQSRLDNPREFSLNDLPQLESFFQRLTSRVTPTPLLASAVIGMRLADLYRLDSRWFRERQSLLLPRDHDAHWRITWNAFVLLAMPVDKACFDLLRPDYEKAFSICQPEIEVASVDGGRVSRNRLCEQIALAFWNGWIDLQADQHFLSRFFDASSDQVAGYFVGFIGRQVAALPSTVGCQPNIDRLQQLLDWRLKILFSIDPRQHLEELAAFGICFASAKFDPRWSLERLVKILTHGKKIDQEQAVVKRLATLVADYPSDVLDVMATLITTAETESGRVIFWKDEANALFENLHWIDTPMIRAKLKDLSNRLCALGFLDFRRFAA